MQNPDFLTVRELAKQLGVCRSTIYRAVKKRTLTAYRVGAALRFAPDAAESFRGTTP